MDPTGRCSTEVGCTDVVQLVLSTDFQLSRLQCGLKWRKTWPMATCSVNDTGGIPGGAWGWYLGGGFKPSYSFFHNHGPVENGRIWNASYKWINIHFKWAHTWVKFQKIPRYPYRCFKDAPMLHWTMIMGGRIVVAPTLFREMIQFDEHRGPSIFKTDPYLVGRDASGHQEDHSL